MNRETDGCDQRNKVLLLYKQVTAFLEGYSVPKLLKRPDKPKISCTHYLLLESLDGLDRLSFPDLGFLLLAISVRIPSTSFYNAVMVH